VKRKTKVYDFRGVPTRALWRELERRESRAYARNVNREYRARQRKEASRT
jgi:hypothetical protein